jgi:hypothetical protein
MRSILASATLIVFAILAISAVALGQSTWLPLSRSEVMRLLAGDADADTIKLQTLDELLSSGSVDLRESDRRRLNTQKTELAEALAPDHMVWIVTNKAIPLTVTMAGRDENVHSLRIYAPVLNYSEEQSNRVFKVLATLFKRIYPTWADAEKWPLDSLQEAWDTHPLSGRRPLREPNDVIIRRRIGGITSATFGVPPDFVVYTVTAREPCVPKIDDSNPLQRSDPLRRLIC